MAPSSSSPGLPPPPVIGTESETDGRRKIHWGWWIALAVAAVIVAGALLDKGGVFEDKCTDLGPGADLADCGLARENLKREDLKKANLTGADLRGANATAANLAGADLSGSNLMRASLNDADLSGADLTRAQLSGANLAGADLTGATLKGSRGIVDANLQDVRGLGDEVLASALGVSQKALPVFLSKQHVWLEAPKLVHSSAAAACAGDPVAHAAAAGNGTLPVVDGHTAGLSYDPPRGTEPMARRHIHDVACIRGDSTVIETCPYDLGPVQRIQRTVSITVRSASDAKVIGSTSFTGGYPDTCPATIFFYGNEPHVVEGTGVPEKQVGGWLDQWR